jgi:hypothetical protein
MIYQTRFAASHFAVGGHLRNQADKSTFSMR